MWLELKMTCILFLQMLVLDDIVLLWTGEGGGGYSNRSQAACQAVNIDSAVVFFVGVRHGWITELPSSMHPAMPLPFLYCSRIGHLLTIHC